MFTPQSSTRFRDALESLQNAHDKMDAQLSTNEEIMAREALISLCKAIAVQDDTQDVTQDLNTAREMLVFQKQAIKTFLTSYISQDGLRWTSHPHDVITAINDSIQRTRDLIAKK